MKKHYMSLIAFGLSLLLAGCAVPADTAHRITNDGIQSLEELPEEASSMAREEGTDEAPLLIEERQGGTLPISGEDETEGDENCNNEELAKSPAAGSAEAAVHGDEENGEEPCRVKAGCPQDEADTGTIILPQAVSLSDEELQLIMQELCRQGELDPSFGASIALAEQEINAPVENVQGKDPSDDADASAGETEEDIYGSTPNASCGSAAQECVPYHPEPGSAKYAEPDDTGKAEIYYGIKLEVQSYAAPGIDCGTLEAVNEYGA